VRFGAPLHKSGARQVIVLPVATIVAEPAGAPRGCCYGPPVLLRRLVFPLSLVLVLGSFAGACTVSTAGPADAGVRDAAIPDAGPIPDDADASGGAFAYKVTVTDPQDLLTASHVDMVKCLEAALDEWGQYVTGQGVLTVELRVGATATNRMSGASTSSISIGTCKNTPAPCTLAQDQAIHRLQTGKDNKAQPGVPDIAVTVSPDYWNKLIWVDPDPKARTATVPADKLDAISVFTHELGHAFGIVGYRSLDTYAPSAAPVFLSLYDDQVVVTADALTFEGPKTKAEFGPIPLTRNNTTQNVYHYGDTKTKSPYDDALMNGIVYKYAMRYRVGRVDLRILDDLGVPLRGTLPPQ
jgi:hypothetical protein